MHLTTKTVVPNKDLFILGKYPCLIHAYVVLLQWVRALGRFVFLIG